MVAWFADSANGITKMFAGSIETNELCIADSSGAKTCLTKAQLDVLISNGGGTPGIKNDSDEEPEKKSSKK